MSNSNGILYIVATPYRQFTRYYTTCAGNVSTSRSHAAEDTRHSGLLLAHYGIKKPFFALHDHNEQQKAGALVEKLLQGVNIALISDAGTPLISDPGFHVGCVNVDKRGFRLCHCRVPVRRLRRYVLRGLPPIVFAL